MSVTCALFRCSHQVGIRPKCLAGMTRLELANQLIEGQPAFHFAFIPESRVPEKGFEPL